MRHESMTALAWLIFASLLPATLAVADAEPRAGRSVRTLVGSWSCTSNSTSSLPPYAVTFDLGGTLTSSFATHGAWKRTGRRTFFAREIALFPISPFFFRLETTYLLDPADMLSFQRTVEFMDATGTPSQTIQDAGDCSPILAVLAE